MPVKKNANTVLLKHKVYCPFCLQNGRHIRARWKLPQSTNQGRTVRYVYACDSHHADWWDGADWDGRRFEKKIIYKP